ncbi:MAG: cytosolic protein [Sphingobium sp. 66-54]|mgnify:CR=1 FL=1|nr:MAG: cytosolic protein [Sphingobium sp. 66-54]
MTARQQAITLIERYYAAFNAGDDAAMLACLSDDIAHDVNQGKRETGKDAFRAFLARMAQAYRERLDDIVIMANEDGTCAAAEFTVHGTYLVAEEGLPPAHGQPYALPAGAFFTLADGLIMRVSVYYNLANWIAQVSGETPA